MDLRIDGIGGGQGRAGWVVFLAGAGLLLLAAAPATHGTAPKPSAALEIPPTMRSCMGCHRTQVLDYLSHGMARSVGPAGTVDTGSVSNSVSGNRYRIYTEKGTPWLETRFPEGGGLRQPIVGRIGAGNFDTSWVSAEVDPVSLTPSGRLFFAPVETVAGHGLALSPFDLREPSPGPRFALTEDCLTCHTDSRPTTLPSAGVNSEKTEVYPRNSLGADAFETLSPLGCEACHGDARRHLEIMLGERRQAGGEIGLARLSQASPARRREICNRCHLQGDVRLELKESGDGSIPSAGRIPVLVPARVIDDHRFVGQMERLALSACFRASPEMTCNTCHQPHSGAREQGGASFDAACRGCHESAAPPEHPRRAGSAPDRKTQGCVDCHMRRSQPFDLPHTQTADHFIRRRVPPPARDLPHRSFADPQGELKIFEDGRGWGDQFSESSSPLNAKGGQKWKAGVLAMGYLSLGRLEEAAAGFDLFPPPATPDSRRPSAPPGLASLETSPLFHHLRADWLEKTGRPQEAIQAYTDALALDPARAGARMGRARLRLLTGDLKGALEDTEAIIRAHPKAEQPWDLRIGVALRANRPDLAVSALSKSTQLAPSNAAAWHLLGKLRLNFGQIEQAREALRRARALEPDRKGLDEDWAAASP